MGGVPVGDIRPVNKRLRELMEAHKKELSAESLEVLERTTREPSKTQTSSDSRKPSDERPRGDFQKGPAVRSSSTEVPRKKKPGGSLQISVMRPGQITPELMDLLYGKPDRENLLVPDDPFSKEKLYSPDPPYLIPQRTLYDVKSGMPVPQVTSPSSLDEIREAYRKAAQPSRFWWGADTGPRPIIKYDDKFREPPPVIRKIRSMLDKDTRLADSDKEVIIFNLLNGKHPLYGSGFSQRQSNESLGDIVHKKVEEYLAQKEIDLKTPRQIDAETGVRILFEHSQDMAGLKQIKEKGWLSPVFKPITVHWHSEGEVLQSVQAIPKSRLNDLAPGGKTVREVLNGVVDSTVFESVRNAAKELLK